MRTNLLTVNEFEAAARIIRVGGLVGIPTETVYGLGANGLNPLAVGRIFQAKGRPQDNPLILHIPDPSWLEWYCQDIPKSAWQLAKRFWPGPLTMILPKASGVPYETTGGLDTVAVRFPSHPAARKLIEYGGGYIAAPSANLSGKPSPTLARYVVEDMEGRIDMIVDGGEVGIGLESTIIDLTVETPRILRPGFITREMLDKALGKTDIDVTIIDPGSAQIPRAPGMKYRHYAPAGRLVIVEGEPGRVISYINRQAAADGKAGEKTGVIGTTETLDQYRADVVKCVGSRGKEEDIARKLFAVLREFDDEKVTSIYSESFSDQGLGQAIMNRLLKAAGNRVVRI